MYKELAVGLRREHDSWVPHFRSLLLFVPVRQQQQQQQLHLHLIFLFLLPFLSLVIARFTSSYGPLFINANCFDQLKNSASGDSLVVAFALPDSLIDSILSHLSRQSPLFFLTTLENASRGRKRDGGGFPAYSRFSASPFNE